MRQGGRVAVGHVGQGGPIGGLVGGLESAELGGQCGQLGSLEDQAQRQVDGQALGDAGGQVHGQQGVAAQVEEVVVAADAFQAQDLVPDRGQGRSSSSPGGSYAAASSGRVASGPAAPAGRPCRWA